MARTRSCILALVLAAAAPLVAAVQPASASSCPRSLAGAVRGTDASTQLVTVVGASTRSTSASLTLWQRGGDGCWSAAAGPWSARLGRTGLREQKREGDGATPAGIFKLGATIYGVARDPGVRYRYRRLVCGDWWDEDPGSPTYNFFRHVRCDARPSFGSGSERLWLQTTAYRYFAVIRYNDAPVVPGRGSAIFLHADTGRATIGCVSLPLDELVHTLRWLRLSSRPLIAIGTRAELRY
jgi:L,D-peptidoglycan transpeptidase YkuD (ErfK/YbiS/YcfS/YnhG family)